MRLGEVFEGQRLKVDEEGLELNGQRKSGVLMN
jgi:hypothetical protein